MSFSNEEIIRLLSMPQASDSSCLRVILIVSEGKFKDGHLLVGDTFIGFLAPASRVEGRSMAVYNLRLIDAGERAQRSITEACGETEEGGRDE